MLPQELHVRQRRFRCLPGTWIDRMQHNGWTTTFGLTFQKPQLTKVKMEEMQKGCLFCCWQFVPIRVEIPFVGYLAVSSKDSKTRNSGTPNSCPIGPYRKEFNAICRDWRHMIKLMQKSYGVAMSPAPEHFQRQSHSNMDSAGATNNEANQKARPSLR